MTNAAITTDMYTLNVSGQMFVVSRSTFLRLQPAMGNNHAVKQLSDGSREYFINRHAQCFGAVLDFCLTGELHIPTDLCPSIFRRELKFWGVDWRCLSPCCIRRYIEFQQNEKTLQEFDKTFTSRNIYAWTDQRYTWENMRRQAWLTLDDPTSSLAAKVVLAVATFFILLSIFILAASTHHAFQRSLTTDEWEEFLDEVACHSFLYPDQAAVGLSTSEVPSVMYSMSSWLFFLPPTDNCTRPSDAFARMNWLQDVEILCVAYFTAEFIVRLVFVPSPRLKHMLTTMTLIDLLSVVLMYLTIFLEHMDPQSKYTPSYIDVIETLQVIRVLRFVNLMKHFVGFRVLLYSLKASWKDLLLLCLYIFMAVLIFSSVMFFLERQNMKSIPEACWWAIITMTTVGYGDMVPTTLEGKLLGALCAMSGVLLIAVTVPVFVNTFLLFYNYSQMMAELAYHKIERDVQVVTLEVKHNSNVIVPEVKHTTNVFVSETELEKQK